VTKKGFWVDTRFTEIFDLSRGAFTVLQGADASVVRHSRDGMVSSVVGMGIDRETGLGIREEVISESLLERTGNVL
jgi:hypothetical protein